MGRKYEFSTNDKIRIRYIGILCNLLLFTYNNNLID